nr:hypothetical protein [Tanacetum cinerariifolium]
NHATRQALGFQNPRYLKKAQQLKPNLYDGNVIGKSDVIMVPDSENTLMHAKENFTTRFVPQTESYAEQAFWSQYSVQTDEPTHSGTTIVEVLKELPKVSMVNSCLKKLKFHLANFDIVVKERTTAIAITEGTWGFEHTKACFRDDIIPFVKNLKELFTSFDQYLIDEVSEVQKIFEQMEMAVEQHCAEKTKFQTKMENVLKENDRLLTYALSVEIVDIVVNDCMNVNCLNVNDCEHCVTTTSELKTDFIKKENYETLLKQYHTLEKHCISLELNNQLNMKIFQRDTKIKSSSADDKERKEASKLEDIETQNLELDHRVTKLTAENSHLKQTYKQLFDSIKSSRVQLKEQCDDLINKVNLKSVEVADLNASLQEKVLVDVVPLVPKLRKNRTAHIDYIKHTLEEAATLRELVESERLLSPLNTPLVYACKYTRRIQELLMILQQTCPRITDLGTNLVAVTPKNQNKQVRRTPQITKSEKPSADTSPSANIDSNTPVLSSTGVALVSSASGSKSKYNTKKNRIRRTHKKAKETKLEYHLRNVKSSLNKASVVDSRATSSVIKSVSNVNSNLKCASCNGCLFFDNHDACVVEYINSVNASRKSKSVKKPVKMKVWKTTGKVRIQELLMILQQTCPCITDLGTKLVAVTPMNKTKQIRRVTVVTSASRSKSQDNIKKNRIRRTQKKAKKTELEDHLRTIKSSLNKASVVDSKATSSVINSVSNVNSNLKCASCNGSLFSNNHDACVVAYINSVNASIKSKFVKTSVKRKVWKSAGKVFKTVGYIWKPTGRTFTLS